MKKTFFFILMLPITLGAQGMWMPLHLEKQNEKEMKAMGLKLDADDIYSPTEASVKDAICIFGGGCTGEMISPEGLLLTNHHCGFGSIQSLSTLENNYVDNGFWSKQRSEELPCPGVTATFITSMEDVTIRAMQGISEGMSERDRQAQIDKNLTELKAKTKKEAWEDIVIKPFYNGNQYYLYITQVFKDVRFVGAPPSSIGKFGSDTDNWVWPRHTGDFALFRVYASSDNKPAAYAPENVPFKPRHFLSISLDGVEEGDFTMVYGFPGRTDEYLSAAGLSQTADVIDPARVSIRDKALKTMDGYMRKDPDIKIAYVARYASIANAWKKWLGEMQGLKTYGAVDKKKAYEAEFMKRVNENPDLKYKYGNLLLRLEQLYTEIEPYALAREYFFETTVRNTQAFGQAQVLQNWVKTYDDNGEAFFVSKKAETVNSMNSFYKDYRPVVDQAVMTGMLEMFGENMRPDWGGEVVKSQAALYGGYDKLVANLFAESSVPFKDKLDVLMEQTPEVIAQTLKKDRMIMMWNELSDNYKIKVQPKLQELQPQIDLLQRQYMAAQMQVFKEKRFYPDANSTLRLTYGKVRGYQPRDALHYHYQTYLDGVMEKYIPGDYEFDVPQKLIELYKNKDFGPYAAADGRMPVAFLGSNHTTGGNSGSPALDARGNLIGLNFDRVWEGTMSDLNYDPAICRNIMVDARYILFIIDKYAGCPQLIDEMKLVKGQRKKKK